MYLPDDEAEPPRKVHELAPVLKAEWNNMTEEEKISLTEDTVKELEELRRTKKYAPYVNAPIASMNDACATINRIAEEGSKSDNQGCTSADKSSDERPSVSHWVTIHTVRRAN